MKRTKKKKNGMFSLLAAAGLMLAISLSVQAQDRPGGVFGEHDYSTSSEGLMDRGPSYGATLNTQDFGTTPNTGITVEDFDAPVGGGMLILLTAGAGYAVLRRRKNNE